MLCKKPYMIGVTPCGCGQCMPCRINRRRLWTNRMMLESVKHAGSSFVTLTYNKETVPHVGEIKRGRFISCEIPPRQTLHHNDVQLWLKRLRFEIAPRKIRYFLVGEYGDVTQRPHYHVALFGLPAIEAGGINGQSGLVAKTWNHGHSFAGSLTPESAGYTAGYVTKKMTKKDDGRLNGRYPEYARMSLRPGIGAGAMSDVAAVLRTPYAQMEIDATGDVPSCLHSGRKSMPLGRYLRRVLRKELGGNGDTPLEAQKNLALKMRVLLESYAKTQENPSFSLGQLFVDMNKQKVLNLEAKALILEGNKKI